MGFTKLDEGIIFSSIMSEDDSVFKVWAILLATCKQDGISPVSSSFIEKISNKSACEINRCLEILSFPDKKSRSMNDDGRRIERVDGGYRIINYGKYRAETKADYLREKQRIYREKGQCIDTVCIPSASASASCINSLELINSGDSKGGIEKVEEKQVEKTAVELAWDGFLEMRKKKKKPPTDRAMKLLKSTLKELSGGDEKIAIKILDQSTMGCWTGLFPLKDNGGYDR